MRKNVIFILFLYSLFTVSCQSKIERGINWITTIPVGSTIEDIKKEQPEFVLIDWIKINEEGPDGYVRYNTNLFESKGKFMIQYQLRFKDERFTAIVKKVELADKGSM